MRRRVTVLVLCVCVCSHSSVNIVRFYSPSKVHAAFIYSVGFIRFLTRGFSIKPSVQKLWCEKANMLMNISLLRPPMVLMQQSPDSKTGPSLVLSKTNGWLQATWNELHCISLSAVHLRVSILQSSTTFSLTRAL